MKDGTRLGSEEEAAAPNRGCKTASGRDHLAEGGQGSKPGGQRGPNAAGCRDRHVAALPQERQRGPPESSGGQSLLGTTRDDVSDAFNPD